MVRTAGDALPCFAFYGMARSPVPFLLSLALRGRWKLVAVGGLHIVRIPVLEAEAYRELRSLKSDAMAAKCSRAACS